MARRVAPGVYLLEVSWPEPFGSNVYVVDDGDVTLVDTGLPVNRRSLTGELVDAGYRPAAIDRVLVTHYDIDHVGRLGRLPEVDAPAYLGACDTALVRREWSPPWLHHKGAFHRVARRLFPLRGVDLHPVSDGDRIGAFRAIHTPGHNPGHTIYVHDELKVGLLGDLVWEQDGKLVPPFWLDSYDVPRLHESIRRVAAETEFKHACMGHGDPLTPDGGIALQRLAASL